MQRFPLFGRHVYVSGSVAIDPALVTAAVVRDAQTFVVQLVRRGTNFVIDARRLDMHVAFAAGLIEAWNDIFGLND